MSRKTLPKIVLELIDAIDSLGGTEQYRRLTTQARNAISDHIIESLRAGGVIEAAPAQMGAPRRHDHAGIIEDAQRGLTVKQIAKERGIPESTVRYAIARAGRKGE
jgi:hypothetical protein